MIILTFIGYVRVSKLFTMCKTFWVLISSLCTSLLMVVFVVGWCRPPTCCLRWLIWCWSLEAHLIQLRMTLACMRSMMKATVTFRCLNVLLCCYLMFEFFFVQKILQSFLVVLAVICIPWMLLMKPIYLLIEHRRSIRVKVCVLDIYAVRMMMTSLFIVL